MTHHSDDAKRTKKKHVVKQVRADQIRMCDDSYDRGARVKTSRPMLVELERSLIAPLLGVAECAEERWQPPDPHVITGLRKTDDKGDNLPMRQAAHNNREGLLQSLAYFVGHKGPEKKAFVHQANSSGTLGS